MRLWLVCVLSLLIGGCGRPLRVVHPKPGDVVRVTSERWRMEKQTAEFVDLMGDTLIVTQSGERVPLSVADVDTLEVRVGQRSNIGKGATIGLGVGLVSAFIIVFAAVTSSSSSSESCCGPSSQDMTIVGAIFLAPPAAALVGALLGATANTERWVVVEDLGRSTP